jgi:hypothetical protein
MAAPDPELLKKFMRNECNAVEQRLVIDWLQETTEEERIDFMQQHVYGIDTLPEAPYEHLMPGFDALRSKIEQQPRSWLVVRWPLASVSAVAAVVIAVWGLLFLKQEKKQVLLKQQRIAQTTTPVAPAGIVHLANTTGNRQQLLLPDSTAVVLYPGATLDHPAAFAGQERAVQMEGIIYFNVKNDKARPFVIHSGDMTTRVLGTSFTIYAAAKEASWKVKLHTGKVKVTAGVLPAVYLLPGTQALYQRKQHTLTGSSSGQIPAAKQGTQVTDLVFTQTPLSTVILAIEENYGVQVIAEGAGLATQKITLHVRNQTLTQLLDQLSRLVPVHYEIKGTTVILKE